MLEVPVLVHVNAFPRQAPTEADLGQLHMFARRPASRLLDWYRVMAQAKALTTPPGHAQCASPACFSLKSRSWQGHRPQDLSPTQRA